MVGVAEVVAGEPAEVCPADWCTALRACCHVLFPPSTCYFEFVVIDNGVAT